MMYYMGPSSAEIVQQCHRLYRKMHNILCVLYRAVFRCLSFVHDGADVVPIVPMHAHSAFPTAHIHTMRVISYNNIFLFNFLFTSNGNGDSIIIRPTLITLYRIIIHTHSWCFSEHFSHVETQKQNEPKQIRWFMNTSDAFMLTILCCSREYSIVIRCVPTGIN